MELVNYLLDATGVPGAAAPVFDLYNRKWPIMTWHYPLPPAKFVHEAGERRGRALYAPSVSAIEDYQAALVGRA